MIYIIENISILIPVIKKFLHKNLTEQSKRLSHWPQGDLKDILD